MSSDFNLHIFLSDRSHIFSFLICLSQPFLSIILDLLAFYLFVIDISVGLGIFSVYPLFECIQSRWVLDGETMVCNRVRNSEYYLNRHTGNFFLEIFFRNHYHLCVKKIWKPYFQQRNRFLVKTFQLMWLLYCRKIM